MGAGLQGRQPPAAAATAAAEEGIETQSYSHEHYTDPLQASVTQQLHREHGGELHTTAMHTPITKLFFVNTVVTGNQVCLLVGCLTSQQQACVSQGWICSDNFTCCHTEIEVADPVFYLTQSQYTDTGPTSPSADPITPGAWQGSHWSANF